jgi:hypothetical protein
MRSVKSRFIAADPDLMKSSPSCDREEVPSNLLRRIESSYLFRLNDDVPRPAKEASQTASHAVSGGNPTIKGSRPEPIIFTTFSGTDNFFNLLS